MFVRLRVVIAGRGFELVRWGSWNDELSPTRGWCEDAVVGEDVDSRSRDLSDKSFQPCWLVQHLTVLRSWLVQHLTALARCVR